MAIEIWCVLIIILLFTYIVLRFLLLWHFAFYFCGVLLFTFVVMGKMSVPDLLPSLLSVFHKQRRAKGYLNLWLAFVYVWE